ALDKVLQDEIKKLEALHQKITKNNSQVERFEEKMKRFKELKEETEKILFEFNLNEEQIKDFAEKNYPKTVKAIDKEIEKLDNESIALKHEITKAEVAEEVREESVKAFAAKEDKVKHYMKIAKLIIQAAEETTKKLRLESIQRRTLVN
ncbi:MAG: hypothetical protein ACTSQN_18470, partial [Candidatus Heimdallarchaeota archaeon]